MLDLSNGKQQTSNEQDKLTKKNQILIKEMKTFLGQMII